MMEKEEYLMEAENKKKIMEKLNKCDVLKKMLLMQQNVIKIKRNM